MAAFIRAEYWAKREEDRPHVLLGLDADSGEVVGYGAWMHAEAKFADGTRTIIRVPRFGLDTAFKGACDESGHKCADLLYAALEEEALSSPSAVEADRFIELFCDADNARALGFWRRQGFVHKEGDASRTRDREYLRLTRKPPQAPGGFEDNG